jgi:AcrR family transcriptional regulator
MGKREDILRATLDIVTAEGMQALTLAKIQQGAAVGSGTLYNYFSSKDELLHTLYLDTMARMDGYLMRDVDLGGEVRLVCDTLTRRLLDYSIQYYDEFNFTDQYAFFMRNEQYTDKMLRIGELFDAVIDIYRRGQEQRIIKNLSVTLLSRIASGIITAVAKSCYLKDIELDEASKQDVVDTCWDAIKA